MRPTDVVDRRAEVTAKGVAVNGRRWFLKGLIALPLVPLATKLAAAIELAPLENAADRAALVKRFPSIADIIATTIEMRSRQIADNVSQNNVLLRSLQVHSQRMKTDPAYRHRYWHREFREGARYKYTSSMRGQLPVRVDSRCPSGFAVWAEKAF